MNIPLRRTRRRIAYGLLTILAAVTVWLILPGDIGPLEQAFAMVFVPSIVTGLVAFIVGENFTDHSERKHGKNDA